MKQFTPNTQLWRVRHCKEFAPFRRYILAPRQFAAAMQVYRIRDLKWFYPIHVQTTCDTLNEMRRRIGEGSVSYVALPERDTGLYPFLIAREAPFVLILPGGGYGDVCSVVEGFPTALALNRMGYHAIVGQYRVGKAARAPHPQEDVAAILRHVFARAATWKIRTERYAVCGFSAGGHLAASWCTKNVGYAQYGLPSPACAMLAYPVITMGEKTHAGSRKNLLGKASPALVDAYSVERHVDGDYPKTFLWQCTHDRVVPFENANMMDEALTRSNVPHVFLPVEGDKHGWGLGVGTPAEGWLARAVEFWRK